MTEIKPQSSIRERIRDLNAKGYYLLVALSFIYRASAPSNLLKCALMLTAIVAVLPVVDYAKSKSLLEVIRFLKVIGLTSALAFTLIWIWTAGASQ